MEDQPSRARSAREGAEAHRLGLGSALLAAACSTLSGLAAPCPAVAPAVAEGSLHPSLFHRVSTACPVSAPWSPAIPVRGTVMLSLWKSSPVKPASRGPRLCPGKVSVCSQGGGMAVCFPAPRLCLWAGYPPHLLLFTFLAVKMDHGAH